jgi:hypothetical protein
VIGKVTRGSDVGGLLRYLYGPGRANEHTNPHLVASWRGDARPELDELRPTRAGGLGFGGVAGRLNLPLRLLPDPVDRPVWQCSMRIADGDRRLSDVEWAEVAREVVERTGFAPADDPGGCRWLAVRHAPDHIHIVVVLARQDGGRVDTFRDWPKVHAAARVMEKRLGLQLVASPDRTATVAPTRAEVEKAARQGRPESARVWLTREVRVAVAGSTSREEFVRALTGRGDVVVSWRESQRTPGQLTGYRVGRAGDVDSLGQQVWFSGSKLSPDLSLPKLEARWAEVSAEGSSTIPRPRTPLESEHRRKVLDEAVQALARAADEPLTAAAATSASEVATTLARVVEGPKGGRLTRAADDLARATRQPRGVRPDARKRVHDLRNVAAQLSLLGHILPGEAGYILLITAHLARITDAVIRMRTSAPAPAVSGQSSVGVPVPDAEVPEPAQLHAHRAAERAASGYATHGEIPDGRVARGVHAALGPALGQRVMADPAWPALAAELRRLEAAGLDSGWRLAQAAQSRELTTATSPAAVLQYRMLNAATDTTVPAGTSRARSRQSRRRQR